MLRLNNIAVLIGTCFVLFALAESASRFVVWYRTPAGMRFEDDIIYSFAPNSVAHDIPLNNIGCIGDDVPKSKGPDEFRVLLLGGSTSFNQTYVFETDRILSSAFPKRNVSVLSCGRPRYTSYVNRVLFETRLLALRPDVVVLYLGINDNIYNSFSWVGELPDVGYFNWHALDRSLFFTLLKYHLIDRPFRASPTFDQVPLRSEPILRDNVTRLIHVARRHGVRPILATFSIAYPTDDERLLQGIRSVEHTMEHFWGTVESTALGVRRHNDVVRKIANREAVPLADVESAVLPTTDYFIDLCHFSRRGAATQAQTIAATIVTSEAKPPETH